MCASARARMPPSLVGSCSPGSRMAGAAAMLGSWSCWGELCGSMATASQWADRLAGTVRAAWSPDAGLRGFFHGTSACLSALYRAERYEELVALLRRDRLRFWPYQRRGVRALVATGRRAAAVRLAESCRRQDADDPAIALVCEGIVLSSGLAEEAYERYAVVANQRSSYLATFRAIVGKYPRRQPAAVLGDLVASTPAQEGRWFAAAKDAKLYDAAIELASGYEITAIDVWAAYTRTMEAAERIGCGDAVG